MSPFFHQCERGLGGALKAGCPAERDRYVSFSVWHNILGGDTLISLTVRYAVASRE